MIRQKKRIETDRATSLARAAELSRYNLPYTEAKEQITAGSDPAVERRIAGHKQKIMSLMGATEADWNNWKWQLSHRVDDADLLCAILGLSPGEAQMVETVGQTYRWAITPYYLSLIDPDDCDDPIRLMSVPSELEMDLNGLEDPMDEEHTNPAGSVTRRYPDRLIINVTNACAMFCRHCQRRRRIGETDRHTDVPSLKESVDYVAANPEIRDVLITGGDPLTMTDDGLEALISRLHAIPHVEMIRIGTRIPVTMPQRITPALVAMLKKYHPLYLNTQFNHPQELTRESIDACARLSDAGIPLGNQMVLLEGVNNDKYVVRLLNHELLKARVRPYYIFHAKQVIGTKHFQTSVDDGLEVMEHLRGHTSGMAIPTYIINAPGGRGKTPMVPQYILEKNEDIITIRTWEGRIIEYPNRPQ